MKMNDETSLTYYSLDNVDWDMALPAIELKAVMRTLDIIFFPICVTGLSVPPWSSLLVFMSINHPL